MPRFKYKAATHDGKIISRSLDAENVGDVKKELDNRGFIPLNVRPALNFKRLIKALMRAPADLETMALFTRKLSTLMKAGIPIIKALAITESEQKNSQFKEIIIRLSRSVEGGMTLSQAMSQFPDYFDRLFVNTIRAGESSGNLDVILELLSGLIDREIKTREMIRSAVRYPSYVIITISLAIGVVVSLVIPKFAEFYKANQAELPLPTRIVLDFSNFVTSHWHVLLLCVIVLAFTFIRVRATPWGTNFLDLLKLEFPIFGEIFRRVSLSRFSRLLATLLRSGLPMVESLRLVSGAVGNSLIGRSVTQIADNISGGGDILSPMRQSRYFGEMVIQMFAIGMESGRLDDMLSEVSNHHDDYVERRSKMLTARLEPILTLIVGAVVLVLALAIFLPMWNMIQVIKH